MIFAGPSGSEACLPENKLREDRRMNPSFVEKFRAGFGRAPHLVARAPGRIEFIGNHSDYNGGTVLGAAIDRGVEVAIAPRADRRWRWAGDHFPDVVELPAGACPKQHGATAWVNYLLGVLDAMPGFGLAVPVGFDCRGPRFETVPLPGGAQCWIFNTHTKHALIDGLYAARHAECMAAAQALGVGLLVDASSADLAAAGERLSEVTAKRARHIIDEIARVGATVEALRQGDLSAVGRLLTASHRSSQTLLENSTTELDFLVDSLVTQPEVLGARLTGGGFGGAVMAMTTETFGETQALAVAETYRRRFGSRPAVLPAQTADGASVQTESRD